ncbi:MAG TPA: hypothetical protein VFB27_14265, partial [Opitutaceae bacterium]|nr:hypothetical protein [Opitutaceae bacterium]
MPEGNFPFHAGLISPAVLFDSAVGGPDMSGTLFKTVARSFGIWALAAASFVAATQWWLVAHAGTDIPLADQWEQEGRWFYPEWRDGTLRLIDLFRAHNGHRIFWSNLLNLSLIACNGQWDPLLQMAAGVI